MKSLVVKKGMCYRTFHGKRCKCEAQYHHMMLPEEMWEEILTRLPIMSLVVSRTVCSSWNIMASSVRNKISRLPQCGLLLGFFDYYFCLKTKKMTDLLLTDSPDQHIFSSGYDKGVLADLSFDFGALFKIAPRGRNLEEGDSILCSINRGLLLIRLDDGIHHVHNPATKESFIVPKSPVVEEYGPEEVITGVSLIIRGLEAHGCSSFLVVRFFDARLNVEYYSSIAGTWNWFESHLDNDLRVSEWYLDNYVALIINERKYIFFLTNKDHGVAIKMGSTAPPMVCGFRLPHAAYEAGINTRRLGDCGGSLHLSHFSASRLSIWKYNYSGGSMEVDDAWVPLLRIDVTTRFKVVKAGDLVLNLGFHEDALIVYLLFNSTIFSYDLANDTLEEIAPVNDQNYPMWLGALPFTPFLGPLISPQ